MRSWHKATLLLTVLISVVYWMVKPSPPSEKTISSPAPTTATVLVTPTIITVQVTNTPGTCHIQGVLPDSSCTPGAIDTKVTQENINQTICVSGYTETVRPAVSYTNKLKIQQIMAYGYTDTNLKDYEEDHLISLELGGSPTDPKNLWPELGASPNLKDKIENLCHQKVCQGLLTLALAQQEISTNWQTACQ